MAPRSSKRPTTSRPPKSAQIQSDNSIGASEIDLKTLDIFLSFSNELRSIDTLDAIYLRIARISRELMGFDAVAVMTVTGDDGALRLMHTEGIVTPNLPEEHRLAHDTNAVEAIRRRMPMAVYDMADASASPHGADPIVSALYLPLISGASVIGILAGYCTKKRRFTETEMRLMQGIANHAALVIENTSRLKSLKESEERFRTLFDYAYNCIILIDPFTAPMPTIIDANLCALETYGYEKDDLVGRPVSAICPKEDSDTLAIKLHSLMEGAHIRFDSTHVRRDGTTFPVEISARMAEVNHKKIIIVVSNDITEKRRSLDALQIYTAKLETYAAEIMQAKELLDYKEHYLRSIIEADPQCIMLLGAGGNIIKVNKAGIRFLGADNENALVGRALGDFVRPEHRASLEGLIRDVCSGIKGRLAFEVTSLEGAKHWLSAYAEPFYDSIEKKTVMLAIINDITEQRLMEQTLIESEATYRTIIETANDAIFLIDAESGIILVTNKKAEEFLGIPDSEIIGMHRSMLHPDEDASLFNEIFRDFAADGGKIAGDIELGRRDGTKVPVEISLNIAHLGNKKVLMGIFRDITERKQAEDAIRLAQQDWEDTFNTITDMITIHDDQYNIIRSNRAAQKILGLDFIGDLRTKCFEYYHGTGCPPLGCPSCTSLQTGDPTISEIYEPHLKMYVEIRAIPRQDKQGNIKGLIHVVRDITTRKASEEKLKRHTERLASLRMIDMAISTSHDLGVTLNMFLQQATNQLHMDAATILLLNPHTHTLEYAAGIGHNSTRINGTHIRLGEGCAGQIAMGRKMRIISDMSASGEFTNRNYLTEQEQFHSYFGIPLEAKGHIKGVLELFSRSFVEPDREWIEFFEALAGLASIAIDNATLFDQLERSNIELSVAYETTIEGWSRALDFRDKETEGHSRRVTEMTLHIAKRLGISDAELVHIRRGALLHDIGKMGVPDNILLKPGTLTPEEFENMRRHPDIAHELLSPIPFLRHAIDIPYYHHEKWDGTGYPRGIKGEQIPIAARIFSIVDVWDALRSDRPYRPAWPMDEVINHIQNESGKSFDPKLVGFVLGLATEIENITLTYR